MSNDNAASRKPDPTRGPVRGPGPNTDPADRIRRIFRDQYKLLAALFPQDGDTMVNRACAAACAAARDGKLHKASPESIATAVIAAHHMGIEIGDQASLVPYGSDVQLIIGPRGLTALAYRSGFVKSLVARSVFEPDEFDYELGTAERIQHVKAGRARRAAGITHTYAIVETTTEGRIIEVLTREDLEYYRGFSKAGNNGPWTQNFEGMCRKTAIKRVLEFVPRSPLLAAALRETETGAYEVPDEMWEAVTGKAGATQPKPEPQPEVNEDIERAALIDQGAA